MFYASRRPPFRWRPFLDVSPWFCLVLTAWLGLDGQTPWGLPAGWAAIALFLVALGRSRDLEELLPFFGGLAALVVAATTPLSLPDAPRELAVALPGAEVVSGRVVERGTREELRGKPVRPQLRLTVAFAYRSAGGQPHQATRDVSPALFNAARADAPVRVRLQPWWPEGADLDGNPPRQAVAAGRVTLLALGLLAAGHLRRLITTRRNARH